jgi:hypothetical protein
MGRIVDNYFSGYPERQEVSMKYEWPWKKQKITLEKDLSVVEKHLAATLQPVEPRPEFVQELRAKLVGKPARQKFSVKIGNWQQGLLVAGGVVSFFAMVIGGIRVVASLLAKNSQQKSVEKPASA